MMRPVTIALVAGGALAVVGGLALALRKREASDGSAFVPRRVAVAPSPVFPSVRQPADIETSVPLVEQQEATLFAPQNRVVGPVSDTFTPGTPEADNGFFTSEDASPSDVVANVFNAFADPLGIFDDEE